MEPDKDDMDAGRPCFDSVEDLKRETALYWLIYKGLGIGGFWLDEHTFTTQDLKSIIAFMAGQIRVLHYYLADLEATCVEFDDDAELEEPREEYVERRDKEIMESSFVRVDRERMKGEDQ